MLINYKTSPRFRGLAMLNPYDISGFLSPHISSRSQPPGWECNLIGSAFCQATGGGASLNGFPV